MSVDEAMRRDVMAKWDDSGGPPVRFDRDNPAKVMDLDTAQRMLMAWRARNPAQFGYWLAAALTGVEPARSARKARPAGE